LCGIAGRLHAEKEKNTVGVLNSGNTGLNNGKGKATMLLTETELAAYERGLTGKSADPKDSSVKKLN